MAASMTALNFTAVNSFRVSALKPAPGSVAGSTLAVLGRTEESSVSTSLAFGTGSGQGDHVVVQDRTLNAGASEELDLNAGLTDLLGVPSTGFTSIKYLRVQLITNPDATPDGSGLVIGNASATQFLGWFGAAAHTHALEKGGQPYVAGSPGGKAVSGSVKLLKLANSDGGNKTSYRITIVGVAA